ncbi:hypothetical protein [Romboutsia ilealis]|uniref:hypothetical protein n=1 Tax=Romboutsia ilealis TaxID=1115758 RepID=UPI00272BE536|nr:hypothetical protein [Romboutsia ilealis]
MSIFLNITNPDNNYIKVEIPIAWKPGINENGWGIDQDTIYSAINQKLQDTDNNIPIVTHNDNIKKGVIIDIKHIVGYIQSFNPENKILICSIKKGEYNIPLDNLEMTFNSIGNIGEDRMLKDMYIIAGVPLLKGASCYK